MAISLKHAFQSVVPDDGDPNTVGSNEWNAEHQLSLATARVLGRRSAGNGAAEELSLSQLLDFIGSPAQGDLLFRDASAWARLGAGLNRQKLIARGAGANPVWGGGLEVIASGNIPAASTLDILNIPQHFSMLHLNVNNVSFNTDARSLIVQGSTNNGSSFDTTASNYALFLMQNNAAPIFVSGASMIAPGDNLLASSADTFVNLLIFSYQHSVRIGLSATFSSGGGSRWVLSQWFGAGASMNALRLGLNGSGAFDGGSYSLSAVF